MHIYSDIIAYCNPKVTNKLVAVHACKLLFILFIYLKLCKCLQVCNKIQYITVK